ncbi:hypothetical protein [Deinococcus phoenicis]|uniref:hypothetical protein n=1 Tax=Deinococcus phoenicis TaxID=1476583 RepID=UPI000558C3C7|nr:hypothetical protein [Deinococcus phoenicis]
MSAGMPLQRLVVNESAFDLALQVAAALALRDDRVLLLRVVREETPDLGRPQLYRNVPWLGLMSLHEDDLPLGIRLARAAQVNYLVLVLPEEVFGSHGAGPGVASITLSRQGREDTIVAGQIGALVDHARHFGLETLWVEVVAGQRERTPTQPDEALGSP